MMTIMTAYSSWQYKHAPRQYFHFFKLQILYSNSSYRFFWVFRKVWKIYSLYLLPLPKMGLQEMLDSPNLHQNRLLCSSFECLILFLNQIDGYYQCEYLWLIYSVDYKVEFESHCLNWEDKDKPTSEKLPDLLINYFYSLSDSDDR